MARTNQGILGGYIGKVGTVVGYISRGKSFLRAYQSIVHNPKTLRQQIVRSRFSKLGEITPGFNAAIAIGLNPLAQQMRCSIPNAFYHVNWDAVTGNAPSAVTVDYLNIKVAKGSLPGVTFGSADFEESLEVSCPFTSVEGQYGTDSNDEAFLFVYSTALKSGIISQGNKRSEGNALVQVPSGWAGTTVHVYGFTVGRGANNYGKVSNSTYIGSGTIA